MTQSTCQRAWTPHHQGMAWHHMNATWRTCVGQMVSPWGQVVQVQGLALPACLGMLSAWVQGLPGLQAHHPSSRIAQQAAPCRGPLAQHLTACGRRCSRPTCPRRPTQQRRRRQRQRWRQHYLAWPTCRPSTSHPWAGCPPRAPPWCLGVPRGVQGGLRGLQVGR
jgi:hypothetical protein